MAADRLVRFGFDHQTDVPTEVVTTSPVSCHVAPAIRFASCCIAKWLWSALASTSGRLSGLGVGERQVGVDLGAFDLRVVRSRSATEIASGACQGCLDNGNLSGKT